MAEYLYLLVFAILSIVLNLQFLDGSNINGTIAGHDEYIAVKEVYSLLQPDSFKHFVMAFISGDILFYGRVMFYFDALIAYIPFLIWGVKGMVLSIRLTHAFLLLLSLVLLSRTFIKGNLNKILFLIGSTGLYYSLYFIMMPKPEPLQLLALALFLMLADKRNWSFGTHYFFLGLAYGLKFNLVLIIPVFMMVPFIADRGFRFSNQGLPLIKSLAYMIAGVLVAVPCLLLSIIKPVFLKTYLHETFGGTEKTYDEAGITLFNWLETGLGGSYLGLSLLAYPFVVLIATIAVLQLRSYFKVPDRRKLSSIIVLLSGSILMAVIMFKTKRMWPHYLWTAYVLILLGVFMDWSYNDHKTAQRLRQLAGVFVLISFSYFLIRELPLYWQLDRSASAIQTRKESLQAINYIKQKYKGARVGTDGSVLYPFEDFVGVNIYHPFAGHAKDRSETRFYWYFDFPEKIWEDSNQLVVFYRYHPERMMRDQPAFHKDQHEKIHDTFLKQTKETFMKDTSFGEVIIYRRK